MSLPSLKGSEPRCSALIDLSALRHNARVCQDFAGPSAGIMAIVKADAYGHGLERVVTALSDQVDCFGVACFREAVRARHASGTDQPILILSPALREEYEGIVSGRYSASVSTIEEIETYEKVAKSLREKAKLHLIVDTGMGRMGVIPDHFSDLIDLINAAEFCELEGLATHFPSADEDEAFTLSQIEQFSYLLNTVKLAEGNKIHLANSAGLIGYSDKTPFAALVRPGLALYGVSPLPEQAKEIRPALSFRTKVTLVRELPAGCGISYGRTFVTDSSTRVATLAAGYGDGYPRHLSGKGADVLIRGTRCPLLGRVTMDQIVVDVSHLETTQPGDEAILIGSQGDESITASEVAEKAGTIPWELFTGITPRVERFYV